MAGPTLPSLQATMAGLHELLDRARQMRSGDDMEPVVTAASLTSLVDEIEGLSLLRLGPSKDRDAARQAHFATVETATRNIFYSLLVCLFLAIWIEVLIRMQATTSIDEPAFGRMWDLLDVVSVLSDKGS